MNSVAVKYRKHKYESDWWEYTYPEVYSSFAQDYEILAAAADPGDSVFSEIDLKAKKFAASGIPLVVAGGKAAAVTDDSHSIIYGETGSKKTRCCIKPLIVTIAGAGESLIVTDVKGELCTDPKIMGWLKHNGIEPVVLNFSDFKCDGYNILQYPFELYVNGDKDKAIGNVMRFVSSLTARYRNSKADPFWSDMAESLVIPTARLLFEVCRHSPDYAQYVNLLSLMSFMSHDVTEYESAVNMISSKVQNNATYALENVFGCPSKTRSSVIASAVALFADFFNQEDLLKMMSASTFDIRAAYEKPTCVFLVVPDETNAYDEIAGIVINNLYSQLVAVHNEKYQNSGVKPGCPVNFVCDEFCNVKINDMSAKISASRSRDMRWYLVCQSKSQLDAAYQEAAPTIIGNCKNWYFLQSSDYDMLDYISRQCGATNITPNGGLEPLITSEELSRMEKRIEYKEALFIRDNIRYCASLPDIDRYTFLEKYAVSGGTAAFPRRLANMTLTAYTPARLLEELTCNKIPVPFTEEKLSFSNETLAMTRQIDAFMKKKKPTLEDDYFYDDEDDDD